MVNMTTNLSDFSIAAMKTLRCLILSAMLPGLAALMTPASAETGVTDSRILIGQSAAFSGPSASLGIQFSSGAMAYFNAINAQGGIHGRKLDIIAIDDQYEPALTIENTHRLIHQDRVFALFGYVGTPTSNAVLPLITKEKIPFFAPVSGAKSLRDPFNPLIFHIRSSYADEIQYLVKQLAGTGKSRVAIFYQDDDFGRATLSALEAKLKEKGRHAVVSAPVIRNSAEVDNAVTTILPYHPEVIIQATAYVSAAAFIKKMRDKGYKGDFYNLSFVGSQALAEALGSTGVGVVISQVVPFPWKARIPIINEYHKLYGDTESANMNFSSLEGFIAAKVLVEGIRRAGKQLTRDKLIKALQTINTGNYDVGGFNINFSAKHHCGSAFVDMTAISADARFIN